MVDNSRRIFPRCVLQANTIILSCGLSKFLSVQRCHIFGGLRDEQATAADYDKFLESFKNNYPGVCDGRSVWMIDCRQLDDPDCDEKPGIHVVRNSGS